MNLDLMRPIYEQFLKTPYYGSRQMRLHLQHQDIVVGRGCVRQLMRRMGLMAIYQKPKTSQPHLSVSSARVADISARSGMVRRHYVRANEARLPLSGGDHGLAQPSGASWRLSNTMDADFCVAALEEAMNQYGAPV